jgi:hypothetical protein
MFGKKFYQNVYSNFKGSGIKHFLLCCTIASVINSIWLFVYFKDLTTYFNSEISSTNSPSQQEIIDSKSLDEIFNKLPQIQYDGKNISLPSINDEVFYIKSPHNQNKNLLVIDLSNSNAANSGNQAITLSSKEMFINTGDADGYIQKIPYTAISQKAALLDGASIKSIIAIQLNEFTNNFLDKILNQKDISLNIDKS